MSVTLFINVFKTRNVRLLSASNNFYIRRYIHSTNRCNKKASKTDDSKKFKFYIINKYAEYMRTYNQVLEKKFPGAMHVYRVFMDGIREFYKDLKLYIKVVRTINTTPGNILHTLPIAEIELYHQMPKDMMRVAPVLLISALPFANYIIFPLAYCFPRHLLCRHFWNLQQKSEFSILFLKKRLVHNKPVFRHLQLQLKRLKKNLAHKQWSEVLGQLGSGVHPTPEEILECRELFSNEPYHLLYLSGNHIRHLSKMHDLRPGWFKRKRLADLALIIQAMDQSIARNGGVNNLSPDSLKNACLIRGLNPTNMRTEDMTVWLQQWLQISKEVDKDSLSLLLHCPILLGYNQPSNWLLIYSNKKK